MTNQSKPSSAAPMANWVFSNPSAHVPANAMRPANQRQSDAILNAIRRCAPGTSRNLWGTAND